MNLSSIITLLQLVLTLLSSPATANNATAQTLANQAIGYATEALQQVATTTATTTPVTIQVPANPTTTIVYVPEPVYVPSPAPAVQPTSPVLAAAPQESCTLTVKANQPNMDSRSAEYIWTSTGVPTSTTGQLYWLETLGNPDGSTYTQWIAIGRPITADQGDVTYNYQQFPNCNGPYGWNMQEQLKLQLGSATCSYTWNPSQ